MIMSINLFMGVSVHSFIFSVNMVVVVDVRMLVRMNKIAMGVFVCVAVAMLVCMLQCNGIPYHQHRCDNHND